MDVLVTDGLPCINPQSIPQPHIPILACNMDLQWMAEAPMPRFGHGAFLLCLEELYKKVTGSDLVYKGLIGKPSEITYRHGEHVLQCEAMKMGIRKWENCHLLQLRATIQQISFRKLIGTSRAGHSFTQVEDLEFTIKEKSN